MNAVNGYRIVDDKIPAEGRNTRQQKRTLLYIPGPISYMTKAITESPHFFR